MNTLKAERNYGIDIIKVLGMYMVLCLHTLGYFGVISGSENNPRLYFVFCMMKGISFVYINLFALATGFLCADKAIRISGTIKLWVQAEFWSWVSLAIMLVMTKNVSTVSVVSSLFPVSFNTYWYLNEYFALTVLSPLLVIIINRLSNKNLFLLIIFFMFFLVILPTIFARSILNYGYSVFWLSFLYIIGAFIKKNNLHIIIKKYLALIVFVILALLQGLLTFFTEKYDLVIFDGKTYEFVHLFYYNIFVFFSSVSLFLLIAGLKIKSSFIKKLLPIASGVSFSVYLIQCNPAVWDYLCDRFYFIGKMPSAKAVLCFFGITILMYIIFSAVGFLQKKLFDLAGVGKFCIKAEAFIKKEYNKFCEFLKKRGEFLFRKV